MYKIIVCMFFIVTYAPYSYAQDANVMFDTKSTTLASDFSEQSTDEVKCSSYKDCISKGGAIDDDSHRSKADEELARKLYAKAAEYAGNGNPGYYYALAKYYTYPKSGKVNDSLITANLEQAVKLGGNDFDSLKWLAWRFATGDKCTNANKLFDSISLGGNKDEYREIIDFYTNGPCKSTDRSVKVGFKLISKMLQLNKLETSDGLYILYDKDDDVYVFKTDIKKYLDKSIDKYSRSYVLYYLRASNHYADGEFKPALSDINKAYLLAPTADRVSIIYLRSKIYYALGQYRKSLYDANVIVASETDNSLLSFRTFRSSVYLKLGDFINAKKDLVIACENKVIGACEGIVKFQADEDRGWNWVYFNTSQRGTRYYYDVGSVVKSKRNRSVWVKAENSDKNNTDTFHFDIDCEHSKFIIDKSKKDDEYSYISPDSIYRTLKSMVCK